MEDSTGKLREVQTTADLCAISPGRRLRILDKSSGLSFLVDTGANISVLPVGKRRSARECSDYKLFAANGSEIKTYGQKSLILNLNLRRPYRWDFVIADVKQPILGADFLSHHKILVDVSARKLIDQVTDLNVVTSVTRVYEPSVLSVSIDHPFHKLLSKYPNITKPMSFVEAPPSTVQHCIETSGPPVFARVRPLPPARYKRVKEEFQKMQELGICRPSKSAWASPLHVVEKKNGEIRPCGDYRRLNAVTKPDRYPIPRLQDFTYILAKKNIFSKIDINRAFHCIQTAPEDVEKTAIITPFGLFEFPRMTFGLRNAAQSFQRFMDSVFQGLDFVFNYIDDALIASVNEIQHQEHLELVFQRLNSHGITINLSKCMFGQPSLDYLGYHVSAEGIRPSEEKVKAIDEYPRPETVDELRRFTGMVNFYRAHLPNAASYQSLFNKYLGSTRKKDKTKIVWSEEATAAFEQCKAGLKKAATLSHPRTDTTLSLMCDASDRCVGAVLQQEVNGSWEPLGYFSKKMTSAQQKYSTYDRELLAIYIAIKHFRKLFEGRQITVYTDHKPLTFAYSKLGKDSDETPRRIRHLLYISEFTTDIRHVSGYNNIVADSLSRIETIFCPTTLDYDKISLLQESDEYVQQVIKKTHKDSSVIFKKIHLSTSDKPIYCEVSTDVARPYIPLQFRRNAFDSIHNLSHPGVRTTRRLVTKKFFWPKMNTDIKVWAQTCLNCQRSKINRHTISSLGKFPDAGRFEHIHIDLVGPLPISREEYRYCLTIIDRCTRWMEAFPLQQMDAESVAKIVYTQWICRYGCPIRLTSDQGRQFESSLFQQLMRLLGINKIRTTAYHPQANATVERFHRSLKAALMARLNDKSWVEELPTVLLGLRTACRSDNGISAAELTFGRSLRLPGDFYDATQEGTSEPYSLVDQIRENIQSLRPVSEPHSSSRTCFVHPDLSKVPYVFVRDDTVRKPLKPPYDGPYQVLKRGSKVYVIQLPGRKVTVSIDRLKPAYVLNESTESPCKVVGTNKEAGIEPVRNSKPTSAPESINRMPTRVTRTGRVIKQPVRFL